MRCRWPSSTRSQTLCSAEQKQQETLRSPNHPQKRARNSDTKVEACRKKCKRYLTVPDAIKLIDLSISQSKDREENTRELRMQTRRYKKISSVNEIYWNYKDEQMIKE